ncbi:hypothetical protein ACVWYG_003891 [Pedobacter sp. UYEF25]
MFEIQNSNFAYIIIVRQQKPINYLRMPYSSGCNNYCIGTTFLAVVLLKVKKTDFLESNLFHFILEAVNVVKLVFLG